MRNLILFTLLAVALLTACRKPTRHGDEYITLAYKQTQCADPWPTDITDSITLKNVAHYLDSLQLYIASLNIKLDDRPEACAACDCKTGKTIYVSTLNSATMKVKYGVIGFK